MHGLSKIPADDCKKINHVTEGKLFQLEAEMNAQKHFHWKQGSVTRG